MELSQLFQTTGIVIHIFNSKPFINSNEVSFIPKRNKPWDKGHGTQHGLSQYDGLLMRFSWYALNSVEYCLLFRDI